LPTKELAETTTIADALAELRAAQPSVCLTATSFNGINLEKWFIAAARHLRIPSLTVLDFWSNYRCRFADDRGALAFVPDTIAVMDEQARSEMIQLGFDPSRLCVTGQPAFDRLNALRQGDTSEARSSVRTRLGIQPEDRMVLFVSQPSLAHLFGAGDNGEYRARSILALLTAALDRISRRHDKPMVLVVRPHPREQMQLLGLPTVQGMRVLADSEGDRAAVALAADLIVGMTSVLLVEACLLSKVVVSLQPGLDGPDVLPSNRWGMSQAVYREEEIEPVVERMLLNPAARAEAEAKLAEWHHEGGAAERVVRLLDSLSVGRVVTHGGHLQ
jgi:UDP-N-acetylglucosamine 2-epimerase